MPAAAVAAAQQAGPSSATRDAVETRPQPSRIQTGLAISLVDRTVSYGATGLSREEHEEESDTLSPTESLNRRLTKQSLQQSLASRKYARYQEDKLFVPEPSVTEATSSPDNHAYVKWGKKKVKGLLKTKRKFHLAQKEDASFDVLWENQRGWWAFGVPHFSHNSLLNFDPQPWLNGYRKPSPVNITSAQVPDPDWEWAWKSWYVDMSRDVDEEGWEYSFSFNRGFSWHGNHPWGHSWVRRRRWLRKRVRKHNAEAGGHGADERKVSEAHHLNKDYFTIHPSNNLSRSNSLVPSTLLDKAKLRMEEEYNEEPSEIKDIGTLMTHLRRAALDREKMMLVRYFVENAGEDLYYLEDHMAKIMSLCVFQNSRRQLLRLLMEKCDEASRHREEHAQSGKEEGPLEKRRIDNLMRAIKAADEQVKKLEYWSDQKRLVREGHGEDDGWQGLDQSGPGSNAQTTAKEKGKSVEEVVSESWQAEPKAEADGDKADKEQTLQRTRSSEGQEESSSSDPNYQTAQETAEEDRESMSAEWKLGGRRVRGDGEAGRTKRAKEWAKGKGKDKAVH